jgi:hypothetical protein
VKFLWNVLAFVGWLAFFMLYFKLTERGTKSRAAIDAFFRKIFK